MRLPDPADLVLEKEPSLPVVVLTGFLGGGKTTLLRRLLTGGPAADTAVIVNEWGEVGLDHHLIESAEEDTVLLSGGCLCCSLRGDLVETLMRLLERRYRGEVPAFRRVAIETSGLADPLPIVQSFMTDPLRLSRYRLGALVAVVDAVLGQQTLRDHAISSEQVALADRLVISKTDLAAPAATESLAARLAGLNPGAAIARVGCEAAGRDFLFADRDGAEGQFEPRRFAAGHHVAQGQGPRSFCLTFEDPVSWPRLRSSLEALVRERGGEILRLKGLVNAEGGDRPVLVNGAQHLFHAPETLDAWPGPERSTRLVFITRGLDRQAVEARLSEALFETDQAS